MNHLQKLPVVKLRKGVSMDRNVQGITRDKKEWTEKDNPSKNPRKMWMTMGEDL